MKIMLLIFLFVSPINSFAQLSPFEIYGYAKYLFSSAEFSGSSERYVDHLLHARLNTRWYPDDNIRAVMEIRLRGYYGHSAEKIPDFTDRIKYNYYYLNLDAVLWDKTKTLGYGEIDRLYLDWNYREFQFTIGRQRIAWGTSWVWNPIDIFNPLSVLDFDYEERPAADAVRAQYYTGPVSKIELAFKPGKEKKDVIAAGLLSVNFWDYDFTFTAGLKNERMISGIGWTGDISKAGFRGELLVSEGKKESVPSIETEFGSDNLIYSFVLSGDYTFPNSFYIHTELLHNNIGAETAASLYRETALDFGLLTAARWSVYQEFAYDITPLLRATIFGIFNPDDNSAAFVPSVSYSVITNLDFLCLLMFFDGKPLTEFGDYGSTVFIRIKYYF